MIYSINWLFKHLLLFILGNSEDMGDCSECLDELGNLCLVKKNCKLNVSSKLDKQLHTHREQIKMCFRMTLELICPIASGQRPVLDGQNLP